MSVNKNVIIAACVGYDLWHVEPFLVSALLNVPSADIVLISSRMGSAFYEFAATQQRIKLVQLKNNADNLHPQSSRYFIYLEYLCLDGTSYEKVLLADIRDVVFQADLFEIAWPGDLVLATEDARIKNEPYNQAWLQDLYGNLVSRFMRNETISCSGTTCGTRRSILKYLLTLTSELLRQERWTGRSSTEGTGYDQGIHNYLFWKGRLEDAVADTEHAILSTVGLTDASRLQARDDGLLRDGKAAAVIHQWDRHPSFANYVERKFRARPGL